MKNQSIISNYQKLTKKIIDDTFFDKICAHCGEIYYLDYSVLYKDEDYEMVICYSSDRESETYFLSALDYSQELCPENMDMCETRIVRNRNSFRRA